MTTRNFLRRRSAVGGARAAAPVRIVHLGLGNFFRAHQAWYTDCAPDADQWGIAAFTGRSTALADALTAQDGLYTLITRAADGDSARVVASVSRALPGDDTAGWLDCFADPAMAIVTLTVTEAGYLRGPGDGLYLDHPAVQADLVALRADRTATVGTTPARLVAGLAARRAVGVGGIAIVSCDNLPDNGAITARVVGDFAAALEPALAEWITEQVSFVTTMVDRITPASTAEDAACARALTGSTDHAAVVTEPYTEWVLSGRFPAGRPGWDAVGARFVEDIRPFEERKLWLLNGGHSLLAYAGSARGRLTIADAMADPTCVAWLKQWWTEASAHLTLPAVELTSYRQALLERFANPRIRHLLAQIAADGSQKLPIRVLPAIIAERAAGRPATGGLRVLAAWINHLRGAGAPVKDVAAQQLCGLAAGPLPSAVPAILGSFGSALVGDKDAVADIITLIGELQG